MNFREVNIIMKYELSIDKVMSEKEVKKLRKVTEDKSLLDKMKGNVSWIRIWMLIDLVTKTGCRVAELSNLRISELSLQDEPYITVTGKRNKTRRVYIDKALVSHIREYIKEMGLTEEDYLLTSSHGKGYTTRGLQKLFKRACQISCLPCHYSIHCARHSFGSALYQKTRDLRLTQMMLGHSSPSVTQIYVHLDQEKMSQAVQGIF